MAKPRTRPSARVARAKKERGRIVAARLKEIAKGKSRGSRGRGYTRQDLEALRVGGGSDER